MTKRARYYSPSIGRFIARDNYEEFTPAGLNKYQYALNNPVNYIDLLGLSSLYPSWFNYQKAYYGGYSESFYQGLGYSDFEDFVNNNSEIYVFELSNVIATREVRWSGNFENINLYMFDYGAAMKGEMDDDFYIDYGYADREGFKEIMGELDALTNIMYESDIDFDEINILDKVKGVYEITNVAFDFGRAKVPINLQITGNMKVDFDIPLSPSGDQKWQEKVGNVIVFHKVLINSKITQNNLTKEDDKREMNMSDIFLHEFAEGWYNLNSYSDPHGDAVDLNNFLRKSKGLFEIRDQHGGFPNYYIEFLDPSVTGFNMNIINKGSNEYQIEFNY